jgi:TRAP-type C4-dicarboxylate transport system permease small subunit
VSGSTAPQQFTTRRALRRHTRGENAAPREDSVTSQSPAPGDSSPDATPPDATAPETAAIATTGFFRVLDIARVVVTKVLAALCIVLFVWLVFVVCWQVFTRQVLRNSAPWTSEAATVSLVVFAMIAIAYVYSERGHIAVEMFIEKLPQVGQKIIAIVIELIVMFFTVFIFIWGGIRVAQNSWGQSLSILPLSTGQVYLVLPIAGVLIVLYSLIHTLRVIAGVEKPLPEFDENAEAI